MKRLPYSVVSQDGVSPPTALPFKVRSRGRMRDTPYHSTRGTHHGDAMLTLVVGGKGHYRRKGSSQPIGTGMLGLVLPDQHPGILLADPQQPYDHFYCRFAGGEALRIAARMAPRDHNMPFAAFPGWQELAECFQRLLGCSTPADRDPCERMNQADAVLAQILTLIEGHGAGHAPRQLSRSRLNRYMTEHLSAPASLDAMARHFAVSKAHLCRVAKPLLGTTILSAWIQIKMEWASQLLIDPSFSVEQVARFVGYPDPFYFSKAFKKQTDHSPTAWREQHT